MNSYIGLNGSFDLMRKLNVEKVYKLILLNRVISRPQISQLSGLNKATVGNCIDFLLESGVVQELGVTEATRGRPPALIGLNGDSGVFIGIELNVPSIRILVTDLAGVKQESLVLPDQESNPESVIKQLSATIASFQEKHKCRKLGVVGVGIAIPGHFDKETGLIDFMSNWKIWNKFPIRRTMERYNPGVPFYFQNNVMAGAMGEIHFGKSNPCEHLAYVSGNWGIGASMYSNGTVYSGHQGFAGRFGHSIVHANGKKCTCGNSGCLEEYASMRALVEKLYPESPLHHEYIEEIFERIQAKDPVVIQAVSEMAQYLIIGLVNVINSYNPRQICIGGHLGSLINMCLLDEVKTGIMRMLPQHYQRNLEVYCSELGEFSVAYGCVATVRDDLVNILVHSEE